MQRILSAGVAALALALCPAVALAGRVFQWTDKGGTPHFTDNLWEVPGDMRQRYLELIEEEARRKYTPAQIRELKEAGDWPPLEFIRPAAKAAESTGLKFDADDAAVRRSLADEFRFQWTSFFEERARLDREIPILRNAVAAAEQALADARRDDQIMGRPQAQWQAPDREKALETARKQLADAEAAQAALANKERQLHLGERPYSHAGEETAGKTGTRP